jgi:hypothetical protein
VEPFYIAVNRFDAYLLLHRLQHAGVVAHIFNEHLDVPEVAQVQLWLERPADRQRAERVLAALQSERRQSINMRCAACGEDNPANFELCWRCGANL